MATNWRQIDANMDGYHRDHCLVTWQRIADATHRLIGLHHAESAAYDLMTSLCTMTSLVAVTSSWWGVFVSGSAPITAAAVRHVTALLQSQEIPLTLSQSEDALQTYPLRVKLYDWLLPDISQQMDETSHFIGAGDVRADDLARALVAILFKDPSVVDFQNDHVNQSEPDDLDEAAKFLLQCSFDKTHALPANGNDDNSHPVHKGHHRHIPTLLKKLETSVLRDCKFLMGLQEYNVSTCEKFLTVHFRLRK